MDVGQDPELTKWSVRSGPAIVLTEKGYKEHHWLVVPPINHFGYLLHSSPSPLTQLCRCPLVLSPVPKTSMEGVVLLFVSVAKPVLVPTLVEPLLPSCSTRRVIV